ncbi:MAG: hypothetical protein AM326_03435 [Candidatus Thorarchaeota archaeon SMTZ-45]|nr:MAG: hypothetical protein AM326_03435 [Candidatus Thorarchaeota archaeon SMTZ-45]
MSARLQQLKQNDKGNQEQDIKLLIELLERCRFYGEVLLKFEDGQIVHLEQSQSFNREELRRLVRK